MGGERKEGGGKDDEAVLKQFSLFVIAKLRHRAA